jgi:hypothetical protein
LKRQAKQSGTDRFKILHFSQSFVVAERFEADLMKEADLDL